MSRAKGIGRVDKSLVPDPDRGKRIYASACAECHGENGEGFTDAGGNLIFPPLWGDQSFNIGAGMSRLPAIRGDGATRVG